MYIEGKNIFYAESSGVLYFIEQYIVSLEVLLPSLRSSNSYLKFFFFRFIQSFKDKDKYIETIHPLISL